MQHFKNINLDDLDACILSLEDETKRQLFQFNFQRFSQQIQWISFQNLWNSVRILKDFLSQAAAICFSHAALNNQY